MTSAAAKNGSSQKVLLIFLMSTAFLAAIGQYMMNVALDDVSSYFKVDLATANWMVLGFSIVAGTTIMAAPALLKRIGLTKLMNVSLLASLAGSLLGMFSWDFFSMLIARLLQAFTSGVIFPVVSAAIIIIAPEGKKATLLAIDSAVIGLGMAFCPSLSGLIITKLGLKTVFAMPAVLSIAMLIAGKFCLHDIEQHDHRSVDILSILLGLVSLFLFMHGLNTLTKDMPPALCFIAAGAIVFGLFIFRQTHIKVPLIDLAPLKNLQFTVGELIIMLCWMTSIFMSLLVPLYLEGTIGMTPFSAGLCLIAPTILYAIATYLGGRIEDKHGIRILLPVGVAAIALGLIGMVFAAWNVWVFFLIACASTACVGIGLIYAPTKSRNLEVVDEGEISCASSIHSTLAQIINSTASALFVGIMSANVSHLMAEGATKAHAYDASFTQVLFIDLAIVIVALVASIIFVIKLKKKEPSQKSSS